MKTTLGTTPKTTLGTTPGTTVELTMLTMRDAIRPVCTLARRALGAALPLALTACEVPDPPPSDGGLKDDGASCGPGLVVVSTGYESTSVAFVRWDGEVVSPHVISSSSEAPGLSAALSGDVVTPTAISSAAGTTDEIVLVDRYGASVLTWVDVLSGAPSRQLSLRTGFDGNAQDYIAVSESKGYASRYQQNPESGREPFDGGSDVLVVDPGTRETTPAITGRIGFEGVLDGEDVDLVPGPSRMVVAGDRLVVLLTVLSPDFQRSGDGRVAVIDTASDAIVAVHRLQGLRGCSALSLDPGTARVAVGCSGTFGGENIPDLRDAGVAVLALDTGAIVARFAAAEALRGSPAFSIAFASDDALLVPTMGYVSLDDSPSQDDALILLPLDGSPPRTVLRTAPYFLGEVRCAPSCGTCVVADAERSLLQRLEVDEAGVTLAGEVTIDDGVGLPPRYLGALPR